MGVPFCHTHLIIFKGSPLFESKDFIVACLPFIQATWIQILVMSKFRRIFFQRPIGGISKDTWTTLGGQGWAGTILRWAGLEMSRRYSPE